MTEESKATEAQVTQTKVTIIDETAWLQPILAPEFCESILASISDGFWVLDREWCCTYINEPQAQLLGMPKDEILGKNIWDLFAGIIDTELYIQLHRAITEQKSVIFEHIHPRKAGWLESRAYPFAKGVSILTIDITERKLAEQSLQQSYNFIQLLAQMSPGLLYLFDVVEQRNIYINGRSLDFLGYSPETILAMGCDFMPQVMHPDDLAMMAVHLQRLKESADGSYVDLEYRMRHVNGEWRWFSSRDTVFSRTADGEIHQILGTAQDITERKLTEAALRESEERFCKIFEASVIGVCLIDSNGSFIQTNKAYCEMLGYSEQELCQLTFADITHPEDVEADMAYAQQIFKGEIRSYQLEKRYITKNGDIVWVNLTATAISDEQGQLNYGFAMVENISDRKRLEIAQNLLAQASAVLVSSLDYQNTLANIARLVIPTLADFCFIDIVNSDGKLQRVAFQHRNPDKQAWFSQVQNYLPYQDLETYPVTAVIKSGQTKFVTEVTDEWMQAAAQSPEHLQFMQSCELRSLMTVPFIARGRTLGTLTLCMTSESGRRYQQADLVLAEELACRAALALDNAHLYQQAQEANRIKDEFLAVLSHELRSPLNPILGWTSLLQTRRFDPETTERALETIERNAKLQAQLIEDLLDISRILQGKIVLNVGVVNLATTIAAALETVRLAADAKSIQIQTILEADIGQVLGDTVRLQQVVWNLLSNAVKFTPSEGNIEIRLAKIGNEAEIQVKDTGKGIDPQFLPYVFDCFRQEDGTITRQFGGLGLGLAIARHITELHGGTVKVESAGEGLGATFKVRLPLTSNNPAPTQNHPQLVEPCDLSQLRILVVDDEADIRTLLVMILEQYGAEVKVAASAVEAFIILERYQPNLLISDIGMPNMDGYALMRQIRMLPPDQQMPAIALTAYAGEYDQRQAITAGFQLHIPKPVAPKELVRAIAQVMISNR
ncbi:MAG: PAS domain S-box protein [Aulosira sp. ZfuVER01]|nr:PAS domain S-box protein [Aulosira sp. ZfuVER01]MDZ8001945.1 PAS domain S-box protein [Aulosira sp. DedVER01a]MDZ8055275.1 PAS domain S-box protein [Aulosira sp. ZfuCHP01]